jgi:cytochrome c oxidase subunit 2
MRTALLLAVTPGLAVASDPASTTSIFAPLSEPAETILGAALVVLGVCGVIFVVVVTLLVYAIIRFRRRPGEQGEPPQVYGSDRLEIAWTVLPVLVVVVLSLVSARTIYDVQGAVKPPGAVDVRLIGHQWWWEVQYPALGVTTANEIHVPLAAGRGGVPTFLTLESADVVHSFWVPRLTGKTDLIPNRVNHTWIAPQEAGLYLGQCAEFCGTQHAHMLLRVYAHPPEEFARWAAAEAKPAVRDPAADAGRRVFEETACINCHTVRGTVADGRFGPDLTHLMARETLGAGVALLSADTLRDWLADPDHLKPGARMPAMKLDGAEIDNVVDYLVTLR